MSPDPVRWKSSRPMTRRLVSESEGFRARRAYPPRSIPPRRRRWSSPRSRPGRFQHSRGPHHADRTSRARRRRRSQPNPQLRANVAFRRRMHEAYPRRLLGPGAPPGNGVPEHRPNSTRAHSAEIPCKAYEQRLWPSLVRHEPQISPLEYADTEVCLGTRPHATRWPPRSILSESPDGQRSRRHVQNAIHGEPNLSWAERGGFPWRSVSALRPRLQPAPQSAPQRAGARGRLYLAYRGAVGRCPVKAALVESGMIESIVRWRAACTEPP